MTTDKPPAAGHRWRRLLVEPPRPQRIRDSRYGPWLVVATVCVGAFLGQLDASIVSLALPSISSDLRLTLAAVQWVALTYLLVLVGLVTSVGRLADMAGRKLVYTYGFLVFGVASLGCAVAPNLALLLLARAAQGAGAAMLQANSVALIRTTVPPRMLSRAVGVQGGFQALGLAAGPTVGGVIVQFVGWRWIFGVNLPACLLGATAGWLLLPRTRKRAPRTALDRVGAVLLLTTVVSVLLALSKVRHGSWAVVAVLAAAGALLAVALASWEGRLARLKRVPLVDPGLIRRAGMATALSAGLVIYLVLFGVLILVPLHLEALGVSALTAGLRLSVLPVLLAVVAPLGGWLADRLGQRVPTIVGAALCAAALVLVTVADDPIGITVLLAVVGCGLGLFVPANNAAIVARAEPEEAGLVSGLLNATRGVGTALGVAVATLTWSTAGWTAGALVLAGLAVAAAVLAARTASPVRR